MKVIRILFFVIVGLVVIILLIAAFLPASYSVRRTATIQAPVDSIFVVLVDLTRRAEWDPWIEKEPTAKIEIGGSRQGVGAFYTWEGELLGQGKLTIVSVTENERIESKLVFTAPQQSVAKVIWIINGQEESTELTWILEGDLKYPVERYFGLMMDGFIGPDYEKGLANLKKLIEK